MAFVVVVVVQSLSRVQFFVIPWTCSIPDFPILHCLPEFAQTHVHWVSDAIQPSHPLPPPSAPAFNLSQHQDLFQWVGSSHQVAKVLELQLHYQFFQWIVKGWFPLGLTDLISLLSKGLSRVFYSTTVWKHQFFSIQSSYSPTLTSIHYYCKNHSFEYMEHCRLVSHIYIYISWLPSYSQLNVSFSAIILITKVPCVR